jgi:deoxyribodipyrimidine photo-lyase
MPSAIVWFRDDLRLDDNPALRAAIEGDYAVVPVYVHAPHEEGAWPPGAASNAWRARSLTALDAALRTRGNRLRVLRGSSLAALESLCAIGDIEAVFWNRRYEPAIEQRDSAIKRHLRARGLRVESFNGALLFEPWALATQAGDPYRVFTPFWKAALAAWPATWRLWHAPERLPAIEQSRLPHGVAIDELGLAPGLQWDAGFWQMATPGEAGARAALERFLREGLATYREHHDRPDLPTTSRLSAHLHFGEIAVARVVAAVQGCEAPADAVAAFVRELGSREFSYHLMHHFPHTPEHNLDTRFDRFRWAAPDPLLLASWQHGRTGVPLVDAGLRELWHTGWMHNRVRMVVASYLVKHLRMHWRNGARWFWDTLVDADLANNTQGWQWTAGTGADAASYFRIFNPLLQAQRFDPEAAYIVRWLPELAALPVALRHAPWTEPVITRRLAPDYPAHPVVDLARGRDAALAAFQAMPAAAAGSRDAPPATRTPRH